MYECILLMNDHLLGARPRLVKYWLNLIKAYVLQMLYFQIG